VQSYTPEGSTSGPTGASQNFSEAEANFMPRLEMGKSYLRPDSTQMNLSLGLAASQTEMRVRKVIGSINSQLTSFLWSARASAYRPFGKWNLGLLGELGSLRLVQSSESVFVNETRQVSFAGIGGGLEKSLTKNLELSALVIARRSFDNEALSLAPVNLEVGVKTKW